MPRLPQPHTTLKSGRAIFRFYLGDSVDLLERLAAGSVSAIVTSPPYNLGIRYRTYDDTLPRDRYLAWTGDWIARAARALAADGSLFLNVGAKPTDPWTALDVAQAARAQSETIEVIHPWQRLGAGLEGIYGWPNTLFHVAAVATTPPKARLVKRLEANSYLRKASRVTVRHRHGAVVAVIEIVSPR